VVIKGQEAMHKAILICLLLVIKIFVWVPDFQKSLHPHNTCCGAKGKDVKNILGKKFQWQNK
jgi:hypothetical protein